MAAQENQPARPVPAGPTRMTPSEAFVETLVANGVTDMFGIMGSAFMDAMDIFAPAGIRLIPVVHEQGAGHMADGYARVSGRHGVVIGQNGPGISNCVTAIAAAYWAHSPVVIITPETGTMGMGLGGFQEANQLPMFQEFTKYQGHVCNPKRMAEFTARCFDRAISDMGPTQLNIPRDYFYGDITAAKRAVKNYNHRVVKIEPVEERYDVYDIEVPNSHNFALASGIFVHNSAKQGRDRRFQAILPLRGKILNIEKTDDAKIYKNNEIQSLITALGLGVKGEEFDASQLRYHRIVIMSVAGDEPTLVADDTGKTEFVSIGQFNIF